MYREQSHLLLSLLMPPRISHFLRVTVLLLLLCVHLARAQQHDDDVRITLVDMKPENPSLLNFCSFFQKDSGY